MNSELDRLTADLSDMHLRKACLLTAVLREQLGGLLHEDPALLEQVLTNRGVGAPVRLLVKAAVSAGSTSDATWAGPLAPSKPMLRAFIGAVDRQSILGRLGAIRVPSANVTGATQTATATASWLGEQAPKPLSALAFAAMSLPPRKLVADVAVSAELLKFATADALALIERAVVSTVAAALDVALLDPANAGTANVKPASLTNGLTGITPAGDFQNQIGQVFAAISGGAPTRPVLITNVQTAMRLTGLRDLETAGVRLVVSAAAGARLIAVDADGVVFSDDGGTMRVGEPDVEMSDTPTATSVAATVMVSSWQRNQKVIRGERWTNWAKRADAVSFLVLA